MAFVRKFRKDDRVYYAQMESFRDPQGRPRTRVVKWLGKDPTIPPDPIELSGVHFGVLAFQLMEGTLTPEGVLDLLDTIGKKPVSVPALEAIGIRFDFAGKKLSLHFYPRASRARRPRAPRAQKRRAGNAPTRGPA